MGTWWYAAHLEAPRRSDCMHGCIPHRRREAPILTRQVAAWRFEKLKLSSFTMFHVLSNAFARTTALQMCLGVFDESGWGGANEDAAGRFDGRPVA
eukprot:5966382-Pyramimonas_sp.AAC.1